MWCGYARLSEPTQPFWCSVSKYTQIPSWSDVLQLLIQLQERRSWQLQEATHVQWQNPFLLKDFDY